MFVVAMKVVGDQKDAANKRAPKEFHFTYKSTRESITGKIFQSVKFHTCEKNTCEKIYVQYERKKRKKRTFQPKKGHFQKKRGQIAQNKEKKEKKDVWEPCDGMQYW